MIHVSDLHFRKEIIPLFDHLHNDFSRTTLLELLSEVPGTIEEVYERQNILKAFSTNRRLFAPFSYSRSEFHQVYEYIEEKKTPDTHLTKLQLLFTRSQANRQKGGLHQLYYFLLKIRQFYFDRLDARPFPRPFRERIENITRMLDHLQVEKYYAIGREKGYSIADLTRVLKLLEEKISSGEMDIFWQDFFLFEAYHSIAKGIDMHNFVFPGFSDEGLFIDGFYHPLLKCPVRNDLAVKDTVTLITGPNMSGKSTLLRSVGLCVYLAHLGLAVPAEKCAIPFFKVISVAINLNDDMNSGYSHFMQEIQTLKKVVLAAHARQRCFAIFDELFRGTNIDDALAISAATILGLTAFTGSFFFISTHLHQLEQVAGSGKVNACCIECRLDEGMPVFTYLLKPGWSDLKIGQIIFRQEGLNDLLAPAATIP